MGRKNKSSVNHHRIETKQQNKISNSNARHELKLYKQLNECDSNSFSNHYTKSNLSDSQKLIYLAVGVMVLSGTAIAAGQEIKERKSTGQYSKTPKAAMKINNKNSNELKVNISNADNISLFHDLPCVDKALKIAVKEKENFLSSDQRNIIRPGIYVKAHKISKQDMENYVLEIAELVVEHKKEKEQEQQFMEKLRIWSIDYGVSVNNFYERHDAEEMYKFVEIELLEKFSHNKIDPKSMISTLIRINEIITGKDSGIREQPVIVSKSRGEDAPDLFNIDQMKQYLLKHDDSSISHYDDLCERFYEKSEKFPIDKKIDIWTNIIFDIFKNPNDPLNDFASQYYYFENSSSQSIKFKLRKLFQELNEKIKIDPIEAIAHTTIKFLEIHPFVDGNGRIARTLENLLLKKVGLPTIAHYSNKEYMDAIVKGTFEDLKFYTDYLRKMICDATAIKSLGLSDGKVTETIEDILTFCLGLGYNCKNAFESIFKDEFKDITATPVEQLELAGENLIT